MGVNAPSKEAGMREGRRESNSISAQEKAKISQCAHARGKWGTEGTWRNWSGQS